MHTLLLYPPQQAWYGPHLGLPSLAAALRQAGHTVEVRDLNQEVNRFLLTPAWLRRSVARGLERTGSIPESVVHAARDRLDPVIDKLPDALGALKTADRLLDEAALGRAFATLGAAYNLASLGWYPTELSSGLKLCRNPCRLVELEAALNDGAENPFLELFHDLTPPLLAGPREPGLVGIGLTYEDQLVPGLTLARLLHVARPELPIVLGGSLVSRLLPAFQRLGRLPPAFAVARWLVVHEGETALVRLVEALAAGREPDRDHPNLLRTNPSGGLELGPSLLEDLETLPTPDFSDLALQHYLLAEPILPLLTSRGCYWGRCAFCAHHQSYGGNHSFRLRPAELLARDLELLVRRDRARVLYLVDEAVPRRSLRTVAEHNRQAALGLTWFGDVRMDAWLTADFLRDLHEGGCRLLIFGQEAGHARTLERMNKGITPEQASRILRDAAAAGIFNIVMYFVGFPGETVQEALKTAQFVQAHRDQIGAWGVGAFSLLRGAPAWEDPAAFGISGVEEQPEDGELGHRHAYRVWRGMDSGSASRIADSLRRQMSEDPRYATPLPRELLALRAALR